MNAVLLTLLATLGGPGDGGYVVQAGGTYGGEAVYASGGYEDCSQCNGGHGCRGGHCGKHGHKPHGGWLGMMPQTCYNSRLGCYDGGRHNHRYPAFHGTYYRRPYNYRNVFDYPWHAELHEPTSNFAYNVDEAATIGVAPGVPVPPPVQPVPAPAVAVPPPVAPTPAPVRPAPIVTPDDVVPPAPVPSDDIFGSKRRTTTSGVRAASFSAPALVR